MLNTSKISASEFKQKYWDLKQNHLRKRKAKPSLKKNASHKTDSTRDSFTMTSSSLLSKKQMKFKKKKSKKKKENEKKQSLIEEESFEKIISETSGLSLETDSSKIETVEKFYYLPNLKYAYMGKNETQRKVLIDQFSKFLKNLFKNDFKQNEDFVKLNRFYAPVKQPKKRCLVLDLDETLIFAHNESSDQGYDERIDLYIGENRTHSIYVYYRPFLKEFLEYVSAKWEIGIFTSSSNIYANAILERIDPQNKYFNFRLFKNSCYRDCNNHLIKDLEILGNRELKNIVMVDNSIDSIIYQLENCVPCVPFYGDSKDQELVSLAKFLDVIYKIPDLRNFNTEYFKLKQFLKFDNLKAIEDFIIEEL
jgi:CTD small phosphatase-like protein 2